MIIMDIRLFDETDIDQLTKLIAMFRVFLSELKGNTRKENLDAAKGELEDYIEKQYPIFVAEAKGLIIGYIVCRIEETVVWAESLFVLPEYRKQGVASALYDKAENIAKELGGDTVYNWVHPNNHRIISFLDKKGYNVLNLIEVRKKRENENISQKIKVNQHEFDY